MLRYLVNCLVISAGSSGRLLPQKMIPSNMNSYFFYFLLFPFLFFFYIKSWQLGWEKGRCTNEVTMVKCVAAFLILFEGRFTVQQFHAESPLESHRVQYSDLFCSLTIPALSVWFSVPLLMLMTLSWPSLFPPSISSLILACRKIKRLSRIAAHPLKITSGRQSCSTSKTMHPYRKTLCSPRTNLGLRHPSPRQNWTTVYPFRPHTANQTWSRGVLLYSIRRIWPLVSIVSLDHCISGRSNIL